MKQLKFELTAIIIIAIMSPFYLVSAGSFTDVPESAWYFNDVQNAVDLGLINGKTDTTYAPDDNLTYAEAVKLASCIHKLTTEGNAYFEQSSPWYATYVDYAKSNGIISFDYNWENRISRAEYLDIFSKALPDDELEEFNDVPDSAIPDVPMTHPFSDSIYKMYRAGIIQGNDDEYRCKPSQNIKRSEVAAILTRMMNYDERKNFSIDIPEYRLIYNTGYAPYDAKIHEYYRAMEADESNFVPGDCSSINGWMVYYARTGYSKLYYCLYDLNENGEPELIFSNGTHFIDIYTLIDGNLDRIFSESSFGDRSRLHVLYDGTLLTEGSNSAFSSSCKTYILDSNGFTQRTGAYYCNSNGPDKNMSSYTYVSTNEYSDIVSNYLSSSILNSLDWEVFADINIINQKSYYNSGIIALNNADYLNAAELFIKAGDYNNSERMLKECYYLYGIKQMELNYVTEGIKYLSMCSGYKDADDIVNDYYYKQGEKYFDRFIVALYNWSFTREVDDTYNDAVSALSLCKGYQDSDNLIAIADKLYHIFSNTASDTDYHASLSRIATNVEGEKVSIFSDRFFNGSCGELTLEFNINEPGFSASIENLYESSLIDYSTAKVICVLISNFTDIKQTDDLFKVLQDPYEWHFENNTQSFSMMYGGYSIDIEVDVLDTFLIDCTISVTK